MRVVFNYDNLGVLTTISKYKKIQMQLDVEQSVLDFLLIYR